MSVRLGAKPPPRGPVLPGFEDVSSFHEGASGLWIAQVLPGEFYVTKEDEIITTVLGSCVSTCIRDAYWALSASPAAARASRRARCCGFSTATGRSSGDA